MSAQLRNTHEERRRRMAKKKPFTAAAEKMINSAAEMLVQRLFDGLLLSAEEARTTLRAVVDEIFTLEIDVVSKAWTPAAVVRVTPLFDAPTREDWSKPDAFISAYGLEPLSKIATSYSRVPRPTARLLGLMRDLSSIGELAPPFMKEDGPEELIGIDGFKPVLPQTYPAGVTLVFGTGGSGKTPFVRGLLDASLILDDGALSAFVPLSEPDYISNVEEEQFENALRALMHERTEHDRAMVVIDSFRLVLRLAPGAAKRGGLSPGFDKAVIGLNTLGQITDTSFVVVVNPSDEGLSVSEINALISQLSDGASAVVHVRVASKEMGFGIVYSARPNRFDRTMFTETVKFTHQ
jgi:hypothetical protein